MSHLSEQNPQHHGIQAFEIKIGDEALQYKKSSVNDPVPTARQILEAGGFRPANQYLVFAVEPSGLLKEIGLDETTDVRTPGAEKFLVFKSDRSFRFILDGRQFEWGAEKVSGAVLKTLAGVDPQLFSVWLEVRGSEDDLIDNSEYANLAASGVEHFFTARNQTTEG